MLLLCELALVRVIVIICELSFRISVLRKVCKTMLDKVACRLYNLLTKLFEVKNGAAVL